MKRTAALLTTSLGVLGLVLGACSTSSDETVGAPQSTSPTPSSAPTSTTPSTGTPVTTTSTVVPSVELGRGTGPDAVIAQHSVTGGIAGVSNRVRISRDGRIFEWSADPTLGGVTVAQAPPRALDRLRRLVIESGILGAPILPNYGERIECCDMVSSSTDLWVNGKVYPLESIDRTALTEQQTDALDTLMAALEGRDSTFNADLSSAVPFVPEQLILRVIDASSAPEVAWNAWTPTVALDRPCVVLSDSDADAVIQFVANITEKPWFGWVRDGARGVRIDVRAILPGEQIAC